MAGKEVTRQSQQVQNPKMKRDSARERRRIYQINQTIEKLREKMLVNTVNSLPPRQAGGPEEGYPEDTILNLEELGSRPGKNGKNGKKGE